MDRDTEARLIDFCARQWRNFTGPDWVDAATRLQIPPNAVAAAAWFVSASPGFPNAAELQALARKLSEQGHLELLRSGVIDLSRFRNMLDRAVRLAAEDAP